MNMLWDPLPDTDGGCDFDRVEPGPDGKPSCVVHGAMNKVSQAPGAIWRCLQRPCRAGCIEVDL